MGKIDRDLRLLIAAHAGGRPEPNPRNPSFLTHVYVAVADGDFAGLEAAGYALMSKIEDTAVVVLPVAEIEALAERRDVTGVHAPSAGTSCAGPAHYTNDSVFVRLEQAHKVRSKKHVAGTKGAGVLIGVVDSGVNILHSAFKTDEANPRTRIFRLWAIFGMPRAAAPSAKLWEHWGRVFKEDEINLILDKVTAGKTVVQAVQELPQDPVSAADADACAARLLDLKAKKNANDPTTSFHGTAVASVAAATPYRRWAAKWRPEAQWGLPFGGVAPDSKLIVVTSLLDMAAGVEFCFDQANTTPCVVNLSASDYQQPRNGRSVFIDRVTALIKKEKGRAFVASAGNSGAVAKHALVTAPTQVTVRVKEDNVTFFRLFASSGKAFTWEIAPPGSTGFRSTSGLDTLSNDHEFDFYGPRGQGDTETHRTLVVDGSNKTSGIVSNGSWTLKINGSAAVVHLWLSTSNRPERDDVRLETRDPLTFSREDEGTDFMRPPTWVRQSLSSECTGADLIGVGNIGQHHGETPRMVFSSSRGQPTDSGRAAKDSKPDLVAPGLATWGATWHASTRAGPIGLSRAEQWKGTSFSAPFVSGAVALMLSHDPTLTHAKIRELLRTKRTDLSGWSDSMTERDITYGDFWGEGLLNIEAVLEEVTKNNKP